MEENCHAIFNIKEGDYLGKSDKIEAFILELIKREEDEWTKIQRNELAQIFNCVPSQINYVISTRFSPERGYMVETRRGGGGYVLIRRSNMRGVVSDSLTQSQCVDLLNGLLQRELITKREGQMIAGMVQDLGDRDRAVLVKKALDTIL